MTIYSMTAFARSQHQGDWGSIVCEIRSINHRYLEVGLHLPDQLRVMEMPLRECVRKYLKRGKVDCLVRYQPPADADSGLFTLNKPLAAALCAAAEDIAKNIKQPAPISPTDILRFPDVLQSREADSVQLQAEVMSVFTRTLQELVAARGREGNELKELFLQRMDLIQQQLAKVRECLPQIMTSQRERLLKRFMDAKVELDAGRLEQEMVMYAQKIDVSEEIDRTETHVTEIRRILKHGDLVGRRLDFLMQELNREANTLGSKSVESTVTHSAVEMKVLIEQVREQVQNIE